MAGWSWYPSVIGSGFRSVFTMAVNELKNERAKQIELPYSAALGICGVNAENLIFINQEHHPAELFYPIIWSISEGSD